jgi:hypothetical protein
MRLVPSPPSPSSIGIQKVAERQLFDATRKARSVENKTEEGEKIPVLICAIIIFDPPIN